MMQHFLRSVTLNMLFWPYIDSEINHIRHFFKIQFVNKGIKFINLPSISKDKSVISSIPTYFENKESPIICYKYNKPIRCTVLTITNFVTEPIFYGDLVYKFKRIVGNPNFSDQFKKIVKRYIRVRYNLEIMRQSACLVLNPITVYSYGFLFNCTTVGQALDSMTALT